MLTRARGRPDAAVVQRLLSTHRVYSPLEWLLETNNLGYDDYRAWRRGEKATLDGYLVHGPSRTRSLLKRATDCAHALDVTPEVVVLYGTDENAGTELKASDDRQLDQLLHTEFRLTEDHRQLDIFFDTPATAALNDLVGALSGRDAVAASKRLEALAGVDVHHWAIVDAATLIEALSSPSPRGQTQGRERLEMMERRWQPAAAAVLHARARDFLTPLWRDIGQALENAAFDPARPHQHAGWAYLQGHDWQNAKRVLDGSPAVASHPLPLGWLAEAEWRQRDRAAAAKNWFALCWRAPEHFQDAIKSPRFPDSALLNGWARAQGFDAEPPIDAPWFPAWMVVEERGLGRALAPCGGTSDPERAFDLARSLVLGGTDRQDMENRRSLQELHPGLLQHYLDSLDNDRQR